MLTPFYTRNQVISYDNCTRILMEKIENFLLEKEIKIEGWYTLKTPLKEKYIVTREGSYIIFQTSDLFEACSNDADFLNCYQIELIVYPPNDPKHCDYSWEYHKFYEYYEMGLKGEDFKRLDPTVESGIKSAYLKGFDDLMCQLSYSLDEDCIDQEEFDFWERKYLAAKKELGG